MKKSVLMQAALCGFFTASLAIAQETQEQPKKKAKAKADEDKTQMGECHGINACKGKGECGGEGHECAGNNSCKGKGWIKMSKAACKKKKGTFK